MPRRCESGQSVSRIALISYWADRLLYIFGTGNTNGVNTNIGVTLQASTMAYQQCGKSFWLQSKGILVRSGVRNGNIKHMRRWPELFQPTGVFLSKPAAYISLKENFPPTGIITSDQALSPCKPSSILGVKNTLSLSVLVGAAIDNAYDIDGDNNPDSVVGEPYSTGTNLAGITGQCSRWCSICV